jgi:hypothetical protein
MIPGFISKWLCCAAIMGFGSVYGFKSQLNASILLGRFDAVLSLEILIEVRIIGNEPYRISVRLIADDGKTTFYDTIAW